MCLSVLALRASPDFPFIFAHNRDEYRNRRFLPAHYWAAPETLLGGQDLISKGMWLGTNDQGGTPRFAAITNFRDPVSMRPEAPSRGFLVKDFLSQNLEPKEFISRNQAKIHELNSFNLIFGDLSNPWYFSSRSENCTPITPGIHGLSNHDLDTPWPKTRRAKQLVAELIRSADKSSDPDKLVQSLLAILGDREPARPTDLPSTGVPADMELALSSIFVSLPSYGTLASTVILVDQSGTRTFYERSFSPAGLEENRQFKTSMPRA